MACAFETSMLCALVFHSLQGQEVCFALQRFMYLPLSLTLTQKSLALSECSSNTILEAKPDKSWQLSACVLPFRQTSSMQSADEMLRLFCSATRSPASRLRVLHLRPPPSGDLMRLSKFWRILERVWVLQARERLKERVKWEYQLARCSKLAKSSSLKVGGRLFPRYLSALRVLQRAAILVKFIVAGSIPKAVAVFLRKGVQVSTIQLYSVNCCLIFFYISACQLGHFSIKLESYLTKWISCPYGKAQTCSEESLLQAQGGMWYLRSTETSFCPCPKGQIPQRLDSPLSILRLRVNEITSTSPLLKLVERSGIFSMYSFLKSLPKFSCCLNPTGVISSNPIQPFSSSQRSLG